MSEVADSVEWQALQRHHQELAGRHLRELFALEPTRGTSLVVEAAGLVLDYSKQRIDLETIELLVGVAQRAEIAQRIDAMMSGEPINVTERRSVLHTALRRRVGDPLVVDGVDVVAEVHEVLARMAAFAAEVRDGSWLGATGERIRHVVNIGIGGSHLGPEMAVRALRPYAHAELDFAFVSNVDGEALHGAIEHLDPAMTLFVVGSKTFTTSETLTNASAAREWLVDALGEAAVAKHFVAVSSASDHVEAFGIDADHRFELWDWVGGRYSVDSAIGLALMLAIGPDHFADFLAGFRAIDEHLVEAPFDRNVPVLMGLIGVWNRNVFGWSSHAVIPYSTALGRFPAYLQQLEMESNGKSVTLAGSPVAQETVPVIWGEPGTDGQHAFFQMLHQGTTIVPVDFVAFSRARTGSQAHHDLLMANCFAQSEALAFGRTAEEVADAGVDLELVPHRTFPGNRPSSTIVADELTPETLGALIAIYEHKVLVQGAVWGVNSFDQWGVELGKQLASRIADEVATDGPLDHDSSTNALIARYRRQR